MQLMYTTSMQDDLGESKAMEKPNCDMSVEMVPLHGVELSLVDSSTARIQAQSSVYYGAHADDGPDPTSVEIEELRQQILVAQQNTDDLKHSLSSRQEKVRMLKNVLSGKSADDNI